MTRKVKEEPLIMCLDHLLPEQEYMIEKAERLSREIRERKRKNNKGFNQNDY